MNYLRCLRNSLQLICLLFPIALTAQNLVIGGAHIVMNGPVQLVLHNAGVISGGSQFSMDPDAAVWFTGDLPVDISSYGFLTFNKVVISKLPGSTVQLQQD